MQASLNKIENGKFQAVMNELNTTQSHRALAIVGGAFVEDHLTVFICNSLRSDQTLQNEMFRPGGALGEFGNKIKLGYLLKMFGEISYKELNQIRKIRNLFAHNVEINDFNEQSINSRSKNLVLWEKIKIVSKKSDQDGLITILVGENIPIDGSELSIFDFSDHENKSHSYVNACRFYVTMFSLLDQVLRDSQISLP